MEVVVWNGEERCYMKVTPTRIEGPRVWWGQNNCSELWGVTQSDAAAKVVQSVDRRLAVLRQEVTQLEEVRYDAIRP